MLHVVHFHMQSCWFEMVLHAACQCTLMQCTIHCQVFGSTVPENLVEQYEIFSAEIFLELNKALMGRLDGLPGEENQWRRAAWWGGSMVFQVKKLDDLLKSAERFPTGSKRLASQSARAQGEHHRQPWRPGKTQPRHVDRSLHTINGCIWIRSKEIRETYNVCAWCN